MTELMSRDRLKRLRPSKVTAISAVSLGAYALWLAHIRAGRDGQREYLPSTWVADDLWRAACWERTALDAASQHANNAARDCQRRAAEHLIRWEAGKSSP